MICHHGISEMVSRYQLSQHWSRRHARLPSCGVWMHWSCVRGPVRAKCFLISCINWGLHNLWHHTIGTWGPPVDFVWFFFCNWGTQIIKYGSIGTFSSEFLEKAKWHPLWFYSAFYPFLFHWFRVYISIFSIYLYINLLTFRL